MASREVRAGEKHRQLHGTGDVLHPQLGGGFIGIHFIIMLRNFHAICSRVKYQILPELLIFN